MSAQPPRLTTAMRSVLSVLFADPTRAMYGLEVCQAAGLHPGSTYRLLHRLVSMGWLEDADPRERGRPKRRHYRLTSEGAEQALAVRAVPQPAAVLARAAIHGSAAPGAEQQFLVPGTYVKCSWCGTSAYVCANGRLGQHRYSVNRVEYPCPRGAVQRARRPGPPRAKRRRIQLDVVAPAQWTAHELRVRAAEVLRKHLDPTVVLSVCVPDEHDDANRDAVDA